MSLLPAFCTCHFKFLLMWVYFFSLEELRVINHISSIYKSSMSFGGIRLKRWLRNELMNILKVLKSPSLILLLLLEYP